MTSSYETKIANARSTILQQIEERDHIFPSRKPAAPWDRVVRALSYVLNLQADDLRSIRLHCDLFLGENTPRQFFCGPEYGGVYVWCGDDIDRSLWASEPIIPSLNEPLGHEVEKGCFVNQTTTFIQHYLCNLLRLGLADGHRVVEIGAGYGGLAEAALRIRRVHYTIIDLPETLIFSAAFLIHHFPELKTYIYRPGDQRSNMENADIVLLPNYRADWLEPVDFAVNTVSFPEMDRHDLVTYLDILVSRLRGPMMSVNYDYERGDGRLVLDYIADRFDVYPSKQRIMDITGANEADFKRLEFRPTFIVMPRGVEPPRATLRCMMDVGDGRFEISIP